MNIDGMSYEEKRVKIAEACGVPVTRFRFWYSGHDNQKPYRNFGTRKEAEKERKSEIKWGCGEIEEYTALEFLLDYLNDPNAMHEAEKVLTEDQREKYAYELSQIIEQKYNCGAAWDGEPDIMIHTEFDLLHATARQRADAFLLIL